MIVGAGIAGLTLALALLRSGRRCVVLEQSRHFTPVGAGVQLAPNASRLLLRLGLGEELEAASVRPARREVLEGADGRLLHTSALGEEAEKRYGAPYYTLLRSDLHAILLKAVPRGTVRPEHYVTDILENSDEVALLCADGRRVHGDAAIGADGVHSSVRALVRPEHHRPSGQSVYRGLAPGSALPEAVADPGVRVWVGPDRSFTRYPVAGGRQVSFNALVPAGGPGAESWTAGGRVEVLARAFRGWAPEVLETLGAAEWVGAWGLQDRAPVAAWTSGRVALVGDAAHPMLPFFAQGADQAVEDAVVLARCLSGATALTVGRALSAYAQARRPRTDRIHALGRGAMEVLAREGGVPDARPGLLADVELENADWVYGHDAGREAPPA